VTRWLSTWLRTTFDYNPAFPLSALALMAGLRLLASDGSLSPDPAGASAGLGVIQAYEVALLGVALLVLWPRKIAYETTSVLIIFGVVRMAAPFLITGLAADGYPAAALALGLAVALLMTAKTEAIRRRVGLDVARWERGYDALLYGGACLVLPVLAYGLARYTGDGLSHAAARAVTLGAWWVAAAALIPLTRGVERPARAGGALATRRPAKVWRGLTAAGAVFLVGNAVWLGGSGPTPFALLPVGLVVLGLGLGLARSAGLETPPWAAAAPAVAAAAVVVLPVHATLGPFSPLSHPVAALAALAVGAALVPVVTPNQRRLGLRALALVAAAAPLRLAPSWAAAELYVALGAGALAVAGALWRRDRLVTHGALVSAVVGAHLCWDGLAPALRFVSVEGAAVALVAAWRLPTLAARTALGPVALGLCLGPAALGAVAGAPQALDVAAAALAVASAALLGLRAGRRDWVAVAGAAVALGLGRPVAERLPTGVTLVLAAFAAIPAGTWIALRRERRERAATPALEPAP